MHLKITVLYLCYVFYRKSWKKIISSQLTTHLENNSLLSNTQLGFRTRLSTDTVNCSNKIISNTDNKKLSLITSCDLSKAFDSVCHNSLMSKLTKLGIDHFWFDNYLHGRTLCVRMGQTISEEQKINYGVPQGSVLGPLLFTIYVNDFAEDISDCHVIQYADDTQRINTEAAFIILMTLSIEVRKH